LASKLRGKNDGSRIADTPYFSGQSINGPFCFAACLQCLRLVAACRLWRRVLLRAPDTGNLRFRLSLRRCNRRLELAVNVCQVEYTVTLRRLEIVI